MNNHEIEDQKVKCQCETCGRDITNREYFNLKCGRAFCSECRSAYRESKNAHIITRCSKCDLDFKQKYDRKTKRWGTEAVCEECRGEGGSMNPDNATSVLAKMVDDKNAQIKELLQKQDTLLLLVKVAYMDWPSGKGCMSRKQWDEKAIKELREAGV